MGYGTRAIDLLTKYYEGGLFTGTGGGDAEEDGEDEESSEETSDEDGDSSDDEDDDDDEEEGGGKGGDEILFVLWPHRRHSHHIHADIFFLFRGHRDRSRCSRFARSSRSRSLDYHRVLLHGLLRLAPHSRSVFGYRRVTVLASLVGLSANLGGSDRESNRRNSRLTSILSVSDDRGTVRAVCSSVVAGHFFPHSM